MRIRRTESDWASALATSARTTSSFVSRMSVGSNVAAGKFSSKVCLASESQVEGEHHVHSSVLEAPAGSAAAREEVEHPHSGAGSGFAVRFVFARWIHGRGGQMR